jgi:hypothetical protein
LVVQLKIRAIRSTIQILSEHAYTLYLGGRLPPGLLGGYEWPEEYPAEPKPDYLSSKLRGYTVRLPRHILRWARVYAAEAEISEQDLAVKVFDWYVRTNQIPPKREEVRRDSMGKLVVTEPLIALRFVGVDTDKIHEALELLVERHTKFGGPLAKGSSSANDHSEDRDVAEGARNAPRDAGGKATSAHRANKPHGNRSSPGRRGR